MPTHCVMIDWASCSNIKFSEVVMTLLSFSRMSVVNFPWMFITVQLMITHCSISLSLLLFVISPFLFCLHLPAAFNPAHMGPSIRIKVALLYKQASFSARLQPIPRLLLQLSHSVQFHQPDFHLWCREPFSSDPKAIMQHLRQKQ